MTDSIFNWLQHNWQWLLWTSLASIAMVILSILSVIALIVSLPPDYFIEEKHIDHVRNPVLRIFRRILRNVLGIIAIIAGFIMILGPGQGILTILIGIILCDIPGKQKLERKIILYDSVFSAINRIRTKFGRPPVLRNKGND